MPKTTSINLEVISNSDGFELSGGTTSKRKLSVTGSDINLTGSGSNVYTFPSSTDTLVGRASTDTLTNKTISSGLFSGNFLPTINANSNLGSTSFRLLGGFFSSVNASTSLAVNLTTAEAGLHIHESGTGAFRGGIISQEGANTSSAALFLRKGRGDLTTPATLANSDFIGGLYFSGYGTSYGTRAAVEAQVAGTVSANNVPTDLVFSSNPGATLTEGARLKSDGKFLVGYSSGSFKFQNFSSTSDGSEGAGFDQYSTGTTGSILRLRKARGDFASPTTVANGDVVGQLDFIPRGTNFVRRASVQALVNGTVSGDTIPTDLVFSTGTTSLVERLRLYSNGRGLFTNTLADPGDTSTNTAFEYNVTTSSSASTPLYQGLVLNMLPGFTSSRSTNGILVTNSVAGTAGSLVGFTGNKSVFGFTNGVTTGINFGVQGEAGGGNTNVGVSGRSVTTKTGFVNIGVMGFADNDSGVGSIRSGLVGYIGSVSFPVMPYSSSLFLSMNTGRADNRYISAARRNPTGPVFEEFFALHNNERLAKGSITAPDYEIDWEVAGDSATAWRLRRSVASKGLALGATSSGALFEFFDTFTLQNSNTYAGIGSNAGTNILGVNSSSDINVVSGRKVTFGASSATTTGSSGRYNFLTGSTAAMESYVFVRTNTGTAYQGGILIGNQDSNAAGGSSYKITSSFGVGLNALLRISLVENSATETDLHRVFQTRGTNGRDMILGSDTNKGNLSFWGPNSTHWGDGRGTIFVANCVTAPTTNPTGGALFWVEDGTLYFRNTDGCVVGV